MGILKWLCYLGLISGLVVAYWFKHDAMGGQMPPRDVEVKAVQVVKTCNLRSGPGTAYHKVGSTRSYRHDRVTLFITETRGEWHFVRRGAMKAWVHRQCLQNPQLSAENSSH